MTDYLNFELGIFAAEKGAYQALVLEAPQDLPSEAPQHFFRPPYDDIALGRILAVLSGQRSPRGRTRQAMAQEFGETLFKTVFGDPVYRAYQLARTIAEGEGRWLRLRLNLKGAGQLAALPWEYLREPGVDFITLSKATPIVRYTEQMVNIQRWRSQLPLRILVMISNPQEVPPIDEATERLNLQRALVRLQDSGLVEVEFLEEASLKMLQRVLRQKAFHVFHYIGHSAYNAETKLGTLLFEDPYDHQKAYPIRGEALARELHEEESLRLVVLNSCQGALHDGFDPFSGVATSLVQRGIPAVVAQQFEITDTAAILFSEEFYRAVAEGLPLEAAVAEGRRAILHSLGDSIEWGTPVLFSSTDDSRKIFEFPSPEQPQKSRNWLPFAALAGILAVLFLLGMQFKPSNKPDSANIAPPTATAVPEVDLVVQDIRLSPRNPRPGEFVAVFVDIQNLGRDASPPFTYEWQSNIFDPGTVKRQRVAGLAPGGVLHDSFLVRYGWWGVFIAEVRLDTDNAIVELTEQNKRTLPVRTDNTQPLVVDFSEPLPNGEFLSQNQPLPFNAFDTWGFRLEAQADPTCREVVPWAQFIGISKVALGAGLPYDAAQCTQADLLITFFDPRPDNNLSGVRRVVVEFAPGTGGRTVEMFGDTSGEVLLGSLAGTNSRTRGLTLQVEPSGLGRIYQVRLHSDGSPLQISRLVFTAP